MNYSNKTFLQFVKELNIPLFKLFSNTVDVLIKENKETKITVHVFGTWEYSLDQLKELQSIWDRFLEEKYPDFNASKLLVVGTGLHREFEEFQWIVEPG